MREYQQRLVRLAQKAIHCWNEERRAASRERESKVSGVKAEVAQLA